MDEAIDRIGRDYERAANDAAIRSMAHSVCAAQRAPDFAALMAEGFMYEDALEITLSWQTVMAMRGQGE